MSPISNDKLLKCITDTHNTNLNNLIHSEYNLNKEIIQKLPIKQINNILINLDRDIEDNNNNIIIFTNLNKEDNTEYINKDNIINFIN